MNYYNPGLVRFLFSVPKRDSLEKLNFSGRSSRGVNKYADNNVLAGRSTNEMANADRHVKEKKRNY